MFKHVLFQGIKILVRSYLLLLFYSRFCFFRIQSECSIETYLMPLETGIESFFTLFYYISSIMAMFITTEQKYFPFRIKCIAKQLMGKKIKKINVLLHLSTHSVIRLLIFIKYLISIYRTFQNFLYNSNPL